MIQMVGFCVSLQWEIVSNCCPGKVCIKLPMFRILSILVWVNDGVFMVEVGLLARLMLIYG